jgi:hypothetical protein
MPTASRYADGLLFACPECVLVGVLACALVSPRAYVRFVFDAAPAHSRAVPAGTEPMHVFLRSVRSWTCAVIACGCVGCCRLLATFAAFANAD